MIGNFSGSLNLDTTSLPPKSRVQKDTGISTATIPSPSVLTNIAPWLISEQDLLPYQEAAILVQYARDGQELDTTKLTSRTRLCYRLRRKFHVIFRVAAWALLLVHIFERPIWTFRLSSDDWKDGEIYPSYQMSFMPYSASTALFIILLLVLWVGVGMEFGFKKSTKSYYLTVAFAVVLSVKSFEVIFDIICSAVNQRRMFSTSPIEALCVLLVEHKYENNVGYLARTLPRFSVLMLMAAIFICAYTSLGFIVFDPASAESQQYFPTFGTGVWTMLMVLNGSNWPSPIIPAIQSNRVYILYFYVYIILSNWGLLNLILGFVYLFFKLEQTTINTRLDLIRQTHYSQAFRCLDVNVRGFLTYQQVDTLVDEIYTFYEGSTTMNPTAEERHELITGLDSDLKGFISEDDFVLFEERCLKDNLRMVRIRRKLINRSLLANRSRTNSTVSVGSSHHTSLDLRSDCDDQNWYNQTNSNHNSNTRQQSLQQTQKDKHSGVGGQVARQKPEQQRKVDFVTPLISRQNLIGKKDTDSSHQLHVSSHFILGQRDPHKAVISKDSGAEHSQFNSGRHISIDSTSTQSEGVEGTMLAKLVLSFRTCISQLALRIDTVRFDTHVDILMFILGVCFVANTTHADSVFYVYLSVACVEMALKLLCKGRFRYVKSYRDFVDGIMTLALIITCISRANNGLNDDYSSDFRLKIIIVIRLFLFPRNIITTTYFQAFRSRHRLAFEHAFRGANHFSFLLLVMFIFLYGFASLGMQIFGGTITKTGADGDAIAASTYGTSGYWPLNFNDIPSAFATMFVLLHVNNMHVTASGFSAIHGQWIEVFFAAWYALGVLLMLNVLTAVFLNEFTVYLDRFAVESREIAEANTTLIKEAVIRESMIMRQSELFGMTTTDDIGRDNVSVVNENHSFIGMSPANKSLLVQLESEQLRALKRIAVEERGPGASPTQQESGITHDTASSDRGPMGSIFDWTNQQLHRMTEVAHNGLQFNTDDGHNGDKDVSMTELRMNRDKKKNIIQTSHMEGIVGMENSSADVTFPSTISTANAKLPSSQSTNGEDCISVGERRTESQSTDRDKRFDSFSEAAHAHESNIQKNINTYKMKPKKVKSSILRWMYGTEQLSSHEKAAVFIQFARDGEEHSIHSSERGLMFYRYRCKCAHVVRFVSFLYAVLKFFERPLWTYYHDEWADNAQYPMSGIPLMTPSVAIAVKLPLLVFLLFGLCLELGYKESDFCGLFKDLTVMRICRYSLTLWCTTSILMLLSAISLKDSDASIISMTSFGSILYVLWFNRRSLSKFRIVTRILPKLSIALTVLLVVVLLFAGSGPYIFHADMDDDVENEEWFGTFSDSVWNVFVAITSSDYPNQIMPAYRKSRDVFLYFFAFICVGSFGLLNVVIVIVLVEFQKALQLHTDYQTASRQILLLRAFEILDVECVGFLEKSQVKLLLDELYLHYSDFQKSGIPQGAARNILLDILDVDGDGMINIDDFLFFLDVTRIKLSLSARQTFMEIYFPTVTTTYAFAVLKRIVTWQYFEVLVDCIVVVLIAASLLINHQNIYAASGTSTKFTVTVIVILLVEMVCKLMVHGVRSYRRSRRNQLDCLLTIPMFITFIIGNITVYSEQSLSSTANGFTIFIRVLQVIRLFLFPRNIRYFVTIRGMKRISRLVRRVFVKMHTLGLVFLCAGYAFASLGVLLYGGRIDKSPTNNASYDELMASSYAASDYWALNFNDFMSACFTLFSCLHVSDFDVIATGFTGTTSEWARLFFLGWYVIGVLLLLNIVKSLFLGEFLALFGTMREMAGLGSMSVDADNARHGTANPLQRSQSDESNIKLPPHQQQPVHATDHRQSIISVLAEASPAVDIRDSSLYNRDTFILPAAVPTTANEKPNGYRSQFKPGGNSTTTTGESSSSRNIRRGGVRVVGSDSDDEDEQDAEEESRYEGQLEDISKESDAPQIIKYKVSTADIKYLDAKGKERLKTRLKMLMGSNGGGMNSHEGQTSPDSATTEQQQQ